MRHKEILENPKCQGSDEVGLTGDRLDPAPCVLQGDGELLAVGALWDAAEAHPEAGGYPDVQGRAPTARLQLPREVAFARGLPIASPCSRVTLRAHCKQRRKMWLKQKCCLHMCRGLGTCTGAISTAQLGSGNLLSHGNLPAHGGVIKRLSPFPSQLRASPPCQGSLSIPLAPAAAGLPLAHATGHF